MKNNRLKPNKYLGLSFLIPFGGMLILMLIAGSEPFGNKSMLYSDMFHQYYPFFVDFRKQLLSGDSLLYNWNIGMGLDYLGLISYYLASPLNLLSVLVPESLTLEYFSLLMPIKLGLASLFMAILLRETFQKEGWELCFFGALYGLCSWALGYQWNVMWLDSFALLPLVVLGACRLLKQRRFVLYTVTLFLSVAVNYYIGFFTCIFILLFFICYEICRFSGFKQFFADLGLMAVFSLLAIGMTMFLELPALAALQNTQSSVNQFPTGISLNIATSKTWKGLLEAMAQVAGNFAGGSAPTFKEGLPNVYCGVGTLIFAFLYLMNRDVRIRDKICCVLLLVFFMLSFIIRQLDYIWHGFHFTNMIPYRFSYLASFVLIYMAYRAFLDLPRYKRWHFVLAGLLFVLVAACSKNRLEPVFLLYNLVLLVFYCGACIYGKVRVLLTADASVEERAEARTFYQHHRQICRSILALTVSAEMLLMLVNFGVNFSFVMVSNYPNGTTDSEAVFDYLENREKDTLFYRTEVTHNQTLNDGALNGYHGISTFTSSANVKVTEFMRNLGYGAKNTYNRYCFEEASPVSNLFLNLKYMVERDGNVEDNSYFDVVYQSGKVYLLENNAYLPLGFLAESTLADLEFKASGNFFTFQNSLFQAATGLLDPVFLTPNRPAITATNATITASSSVRCSYKDCTSGAYIHYTYTIDTPGFMCIYLDLSDRNSYNVYKNGQHLFSETVSLDQMMAIGDVAAGDTVEIRLYCANGESGSMNIYAGIVDETVFRQGVDILQASQLELTTFENTLVEGNISCNRDGLLYTSIPNDGNWILYVDGVATEPTLVGDVMLSVPLTQGEHSIRFQYRSQAFLLGGYISLGCLALFLALTVPAAIQRRKHGKFTK